MKVSRMQLAADRSVPAQRRPRRAAARQHRAARPVVALGRLHPVRARRRGGRRAARRAGISGRRLRPHALFPGLSRARSALRLETYVRIVRDILDGLKRAGLPAHPDRQRPWRQPAGGKLAIEWMADNPGTAVKFHNWWNAPATLAKVQEIDPVASHASWMENFPWTRLAGVQAADAAEADDRSCAHARRWIRKAVASYLGDGNFGGYYERPDEDMLAIWDVAVAETRALLEGAGHEHERADPDLGRRRHRRHARRGVHPGGP